MDELRPMFDRMRLQWSRVPKDAETAQNKQLNDQLDQASMEPRPEGRGNHGGKLIPLSGTVASMEPRPEGRGNQLEDQKREQMIMLQWSRVPKDAETHDEPVYHDGRYMLQWSRVPKDAET